MSNTKPTRSPLPGWEGNKLAAAVLWISPVSELGVRGPSNGIFNWWASLDGGDSYFAGQADTLEQAQIVAEDAARSWLGWVADTLGWLAPIPSPAVCEAVAAYKAAVDARDGEEEARVQRIRGGGSNSATVLAEFVEEVEYRAEMLAYALRAELGEVDG